MYRWSIILFAIVLVGGERNKRDMVNLIADHDAKKFNSDELRDILLQNIKEDVPYSMLAIRQAVAMNHSDFMVTCNSNPLSFFADVDDFCQVEVNSVHCAMLKINVRHETNSVASDVAPSVGDSSIPIVIRAFKPGDGQPTEVLVEEAA